MNQRFLLAIMSMLFISFSYAQDMTQNASGTTFGIRAGVNFQNINGRDAADNELENDITTGFHAGVNAEIPVGTGSYLQPGVLYSMKGAQMGDNNKISLSYVEIPVNFIYKPILSTGNMLLGFGPYVAFGIGGKIDINGTEMDIDFGSDYDVMDPTTRFKGFDAGANFLAGYEFANSLSFQINAQLGLVDINKENPSDPDDDTRWRNTGFGLSIGYRF